MTIRERIKALCKSKGISINKLEMDCGVAKGYVSKLDKSTPNATKLQILADHLNVSLDYLITGNEDNTYYLDSDTKDIAQKIFENKDLRLLFDAAKDASADDLNTVHAMLLALKNKERRNND